MKNQNKPKKHSNKHNTKETLLTNDKIKNLLENDYCQKSIGKIEDIIENIDVDINHLEKIFTNETYYLAMKIVPLLERKVLYLTYVENVRLNDICRRLKLPKKQVIVLKNKAIMHFKNNLNTLAKADTVKGGGKNV